MFLLVMYLPAALVALWMLFSRRAGLGVRGLYALATLVFPAAVLVAALGLLGIESSGGGALGLLVFAFLAVPLLMAWVFVRRHPIAMPRIEGGRVPLSQSEETSVSAEMEEADVAATDPCPQMAERIRVFRVAGLVQAPGSVMLGLGIAEKLTSGDEPIFPFFANGWVVDGLLLVGGGLFAVSVGMILKELRRWPEPERDEGVLGTRNPRR